VRGTHPTLAVATVKINDKHIEVIVRHMLRIPHNPLYLFCQCHIVATNLRPKKIRFFQKIGFLSPKKIRFFQKNRIFKPQFIQKIGFLNPKKIRFFQKIGFLNPKKIRFFQKIGFLSPKKKSDFYPRSAAKRGNACLHRSAVQFVHTPMWFKPEQVLFI
jgi:DNA-binding transcriptional MerR regulator